MKTLSAPAAMSLVVGLLLSACSAKDRAAPDALEGELRGSFRRVAARILDGPGFQAAPGGGWTHEHSRLSARFPARASGPLVFAPAPDFEIEVFERGIEGEGVRVGAALAFRRPDGASYWAATPTGYEEWVSVVADPTGLAAVEWEVRGGEVVASRGLVFVNDEEGTRRLTVTAPSAWGEGERRLRPILSSTNGVVRVEVLARPGERVLIDPIWSVSGTMNAARKGFSLTLLSGGRVLAIGGEDTVGTLDTAEMLDPATDVWTAVAPMAAARKRHTATLLPDGRVLVIGGFTGTVPLTSSAIYDPAADSWSPGAMLTAARGAHTATLLSDGRILVLGGANSFGELSSAEILAADQSAFASVPNMAGSRAEHTATLLQSGRVLVAGGVTTSVALSSAQRFDPTTDSWIATTGLPDPRYGHTAVRLTDGQVLIAGGTDGTSELASTVRYDPGGDAWVDAGAITGRVGHTATLLPNGDLLLAGGASAGSPASSSLFDVSTGLWSAVVSPAVDRSGHVATVLASGLVMVVGGEDVTPLASTEVFDLQDAVSTVGPGMGLNYVAATLVPLKNGKILLLGGTGTIDTDFARLYEPSTGIWTSAGTVDRRDTGHTATLLPDGRVLLIGGKLHSTGAFTGECLLYDPVAGTWTAALPSNAVRAGHSATLLNDGRVFVAGSVGTALTRVTSTQIYDPVSEAWTDTTPMRSGRGNHVASLLSTGEVIVINGVVPTLFGGFLFLDTVEVYDPVTDSWRDVPGVGQLWLMHAAPLPDGMLLLGPGRLVSTNVSTTQIFDPATDTWTVTGPTSIPRAQYAMVTLPDGRVLVTGGGNSSSEIYDPGRRTWTGIGSMSAVRTAHSGVLLEDNRVLFVGGNLTVHAETLDIGRFGSFSWAPSLSVPATVTPGTAVNLVGARFTSGSPGGDGRSGSPMTNHPVVLLRRVDDGRVHALPLTGWTDNSAQLPLPAMLPMGPYQIWISVNGVRSPGRATTLGPGAAAQLVIETTSQTLLAGSCSTAVTFTVIDSVGNPSVSPTDRVVDFTSSSTSLQFFSDGSCSTGVTSVTVPPGQSGAALYFSDPSAGTHQITISSTGLGSDSQAQTILPGSPTKVGFATAPQTLEAGACSTEVRVEIQDTASNPVTLATDADVILTTPSPTLQFFSDSGCTNALVTPPTIVAGDVSASFYFTESAVSTPTIEVAIQGLLPGSQLEMVVAGPPSVLSFTTSPQTIQVGACSGSTTVQATDAFLNPTPVTSLTTVSLAAPASPTMRFFADPACIAAVTAVAMNAGADTVTFYFQDSAAGTPDIDASATGFVVATQTVTIFAGPPSALAFQTLPGTVVTGVCSVAIRVEVLDALGNTATPASLVPIGLGASTATGGFFLDDVCTVGTGSVAILAGTQSATFYFSDTQLGTTTLTATDSSAQFGQTSQDWTVSSGIPPAITSSAATSAVATVPYLYDADGFAEATGAAPLIWSVTLAPAGFFIDSGSGLVTWTPSAPGSVDLCIEAANPFGQDPQCFTVTVVPAAPAVIVSTPTTVAVEGQAYTYDADDTVEAEGIAPITFTATGPAEFAVDSASGLVTWTPAAPGNVEIVITATNAFGSDDQTFNVTVYPVGSGAAPIILHSANLTAALGIPYVYDDDGVAESAGDLPLTWSQTEGPEQFQIDASTGQTSWTPSAVGTIRIGITAQNSFGTDTYTFDVEVSEVSSSRTPTAVMQVIPASGPAPLAVSVDGLNSFTADGGPVVYYEWNFGDGTPSAYGATAQHTYVVAGGYLARLTVRDALGRSATDVAFVTALQVETVPPRARIIANETTGDLSLTVDFSCVCAGGSSPIAAYRWEFGDGEIATGPLVSHTFGPGSYHVRLTVVDENSLTAWDQLEIRVGDTGNLPPSLIARAEPTAGPAPLEVQYLSLFVDSDGTISGVEWTFSDGQTSTEPNPVRTYAEPGSYLATAVVLDDDGAAATAIVEITVTSPAGAVAPQILSVPATQAIDVGASYRYDADGRPEARGDRPITWSLGKTVGPDQVGVPEGMTIDPQTGEISWVPNEDAAGTADIVLVVTNDVGTDVQEWSVEVIGFPDGTGCCSSARRGGSVQLLFLAVALVWLRRRRPHRLRGRRAQPPGTSRETPVTSR